MEEQPEELQPDDVDGEPSSEDASPQSRPVERQAHRRARDLPVDQRALNIVGIAQARDYLRAGRAATTNLGRPCPSCGSVVTHVAPDDPDLIVICAGCGTVSRNVSPEQLGLDEPPTEDQTPTQPDEDELQRSVDRHPANRSRARRQN